MSENEPNTIETLTERYNALGFETITTSMTTGPDESRAINDLWEIELQRTLKAFRFTSWTLSHCLDIRISMLLQHNMQGDIVRSDGSIGGPKTSDNRLTQLVFDGDTQILLSMIETRDVINHQVVQLARYSLREASIRNLETLVDVDNTYRLEHFGAQ